MNKNPDQHEPEDPRELNLPSRSLGGWGLPPDVERQVVRPAGTRSMRDEVIYADPYPEPSE